MKNNYNEYMLYIYFSLIIILGIIGAKAQLNKISYLLIIVGFSSTIIWTFIARNKVLSPISTALIYDLLYLGSWYITLALFEKLTVLKYLGIALIIGGLTLFGS